MISRTLSRPTVRAVVGMSISALFLAATASAIDLRLLAEAWSRVGFALLIVAAAASVLELNVRAARWRLLLRRLAPIGHFHTLGYLSLGHLANAILPARLGDVARALVTGAQLRAPRSSVLGTIAVERISDTALLGFAVAIGVLIGYRQLAPAVAALLVAGVAAAAVAAVAFLVLRREAIVMTRVGSFLGTQAARFWEGASGLRTPSQAGAWALLTATSFGITIGIFALVASAVGLTMPIWQAALVMAAVTLSTAIPAGPASIGTYEFVGMTVMVSMGFAAEPALLSVALVHATAVLPTSLIGLGAMWWLGIGLHGTRVPTNRTAAERIG